MRDDRLDELRNAYYGVEIPEELESIVNVSIRRAKRDVIRENKRMKRRFPIAGKVGMGLVAAMLALIVVVNVNRNVAYAMSNIPVIGSFIKVITFDTFESRDDKMSAHVETPRVEVDTENEQMKNAVDELNKTVEDYTAQAVAEYKKDVISAGGDGIEDLVLDYEVITDNDKLFSLRMNKVILLNTSNITIKIYHINKENGKLITLPDIMKADSDYLNVITEEIKRQMREQMASDNTISYFLDKKDIPGLNWTGITEEANFYFDEEGKLTFIFDKYEVAPGAMGVCEFVIPDEVAATVLLEDYMN